MHLRRAAAAALVMAVGAAGIAPATAGASELVGRNVHAIHLLVNRYAVARITYTTSSGKVVHVLAWGAVNARRPNPSIPQVRFKLNFAGGWGSPFGSGYWRIMHNACLPYTGPRLPNLVAACRAPDGSFWALQTWIHLASDGGWKNNAPVELQLSHWKGAAPRLTLYQNWERNTAIDRVFGEFSYAGTGVYGFSSTSTGNPTDGYGRNVYVDVHNVAWRATAWDLGAGWYRFNSGLAHRPAAGALLANGQPAPGGGFCLGMFPMYGRTLPADGNAYRATAMGPGVTPIVRAGPIAEISSYSAAKQQQLIAFEQTFTPSSDSCYNGGV
ncbi:MAG TPA: hypothetical protein VMU66_05575 [Gaiellales bacterium]|nr:hypothetical protein [Gaiellales bacterium]